MPSIIQQLYDGELRPDLRTPETDEFLESCKAFQKDFAALKGVMPDLEPRLSALIDDYAGMGGAERRDMFQYGFSLGVRLIVEALSQ